MAQMNVSVPDALKAWAEARVAEGRYSSTSDYVRDLMRRDQERAERIASLQRLIDEGRASGIGDRTMQDLLAEGKRRVGLDEDL
jgi:antitoxin ParD1/3/4